MPIVKICYKTNMSFNIFVKKKKVKLNLRHFSVAENSIPGPDNDRACQIHGPLET